MFDVKTAEGAEKLRTTCQGMIDAWKATAALEPGPDGGFFAAADAVARAAVALLAERDALAKFKTFVHGRLDQAGIPPDPGGPHSLEECRIGDRLDLVFARIEKLETAVQSFVDYYDQAGIGPCLESNDDEVTGDGFDGDERFNVRLGRAALAK